MRRALIILAFIVVGVLGFAVGAWSVRPTAPDTKRLPRTSDRRQADRSSEREIPGSGEGEIAMLREWWFPEVATLMSEERSLENVTYFLSASAVAEMVDRHGVFEAMLIEPSHKNAVIGFWTDERKHFKDDIAYFPVSLGGSFGPRSLTETGVPEGTIVIVRYQAILRRAPEGEYYLDGRTLLGYSYMPLAEARLLGQRLSR